MPEVTIECMVVSLYSFDYNTPYIVSLGHGRIIAGMDRGLMDMCLWERRRVTIPPHLGYGRRGVGQVIPANSTLIFYTRLIKIERVSQFVVCDHTLGTVDDFWCGCLFGTMRYKSHPLHWKVNF